MPRIFFLLFTFYFLLFTFPTKVSATCDPNIYDTSHPKEFHAASCPSGYCELSHNGPPTNPTYTCAPPTAASTVQQTCNTDVVSNPSYPLAKCSDLESKHYTKDGTSQSCTANGKDGRGCPSIGDSLCKEKDGDDPTKYLCYKPPATTSGSQPCPVDEEDANDVSKQTGVLTAIGCVPTQPQDFIPAVIKFVTFAAGGIALLLMAIGAIRMITSAGNAEALKAAQEQFTSAIIGLLFIIFAVLLLQIIGVDILNIPGFSKK